MNGPELQAAIRRRMPELPVIVITAFPDDAVRRRALNAGASDFPDKPVARETVARSIRQALPCISAMRKMQAWSLPELVRMAEELRASGEEEA